MLEQARLRTAEFQHSLLEKGIDVAVVTDESTIAYLAGFWGYLSVEFGRPTFLLVRPHEPPVVITPLMESEMIGAMTWVERVITWEDTGNNRWEKVLSQSLGSQPGRIGIEASVIPAMVRNHLDAQFPSADIEDISAMLNAMRMIKSSEEIEVMKQAGQIAGAMMTAAENTLAEGVPEYEVALAVIEAGTRKAAGFLTDLGWEAFVSPMIHNLQIMQSGRNTSMVHPAILILALGKFR